MESTDVKDPALKEVIPWPISQGPQFCFFFYLVYFIVDHFQESKGEIELPVSSEVEDSTTGHLISERNQRIPHSNDDENRRSLELTHENVETVRQASLKIGDDTEHLTSVTDDNENKKSVRLFKHVKETLQEKKHIICENIRICGTNSTYKIRFYRHNEPLQNYVFFMLCMISVLLEPLFFYTPVMKDDKKCFKLGKALGIYAVVHRSITDLIYLVCTIWRWLDNYSHESKIKRSLFFSFDLSTVLPLPQVVVIFVLNKRIRGTKFLLAMKFFIGQHVLRVMRLSTLFLKVKPASNHAWWALVRFIISYIHAGHVIGAAWYFFAIERKIQCWRKACMMNQSECENHSFYCDDSSGNFTFSNDFCSTKTNNTSTYDFGIFQDAIHSGIVEEANFFLRLIACFRWGIQSLSYFGQGLTLSTNALENIFALTITTIGIVLFFFFIGKVQMYVQSESEKWEEIRQKIGECPLFKRLPPILQERIKRCRTNKWPETTSVDVEYLVNNLPDDLKVGVKKNLCSDLLNKVEEFRNWDFGTKMLLFYHLKPVVYTKTSYIVEKHEPIDRMVFVMEGNFWPLNLTGSLSEAQTLQKYLEDGVFWEKEVFDWIKRVRDGSGSSDFPKSFVTIQAQTKVEAFVLMAADLKICYEDHLAYQDG